MGVESISTHKEMGRLTVDGNVNPTTLVTCVKKFVKIAAILNIENGLGKFKQDIRKLHENGISGYALY